MQSKKRSRNRYVYVIIAIVLISGFMVVRARKSADTTPIITTAAVDRGEVKATVSANGTLEPLTTVEVKSNVGGSIVKLAVDEGDTVKAGQLIARIDPTDSQTALDEAQADLAADVSKAEQARLQLAIQKEETSANIASSQHALESARAKLIQAQEEANAQPALTAASIKQAKNSYAAALSNYKQTKTALVPQKRSSVKASYDQAKASFETSEKNYNRQKALFEKGYISKGAFDTAEETYNLAKASFDSAKSKLETVDDEIATDLSSAEAKMEQAKADLDSANANQMQVKVKHQAVIAAQATLKQAEASLKIARANVREVPIRQGDIIQAGAQVTRSQASLVSAKTTLGYTTILAPRNGVVTAKYVEEGSIVTAGRSSSLSAGSGVSIVDIADVSRMFAKVDVDETDIAQIEVGQDVELTVEAYPDEVFTGKVTKIAPQSVEESNVTTIPVTVEVDLPDGRLKPGMNVTCDFITDFKNDVIRVPNEAVKEANNGNTVTIIRDGKQIEQKVEVGLVGSEYTEILKGLRKGQKIVTATLAPNSATGNSFRPSSPGVMGGGGLHR